MGLKSSHPAQISFLCWRVMFTQCIYYLDTNFSSSKSKAHLNPKFSFLFCAIFEDGTMNIPALSNPFNYSRNPGFLPPLILTPKDFPKPAEQINVLLWFRPLRPLIRTITRMHPVSLQTVNTAVRKVFLKSKSE